MVFKGTELLPPVEPNSRECDQIEAMFNLLGFMRNNDWIYEKKMVDNILIIDRFKAGDDAILGRVAFSGSQEEIAALIEVFEIAARTRHVRS